MKRLRCNGTYQTLRDVVAPYKIESIRDLGEPGYDSLKSDKKPTLPCSKSAPMLTIRFTNGCAVQLRPSGTEPKLKFYIEMKGQPGFPREVVENDLASFVKFVLDKLLKPEENGLKKAV